MLHFSLTKEYLKAIRECGFIKSSQIVAEMLFDFIYCLFSPYNFTGYKNEPRIGCKPYIGVRRRPLEILLKKLNVSHNGAFVDLGFGKGKALITAADYGFQKLRGAELNSELYETTVNNIKIYKKNNVRADFNLLNQDIIQFKFDTKDQILFIYDPVPLNETVQLVNMFLNSKSDLDCKRNVIFHHNFYNERDIAKIGIARKHEVLGHTFYVF